MVTLADIVGMQVTRLYFISYHGKCLADSRAANLKGELGRLARDERVADIVGGDEIVQALKRRNFDTSLVPETLPDYPAVSSSKMAGIRGQHARVLTRRRPCQRCSRHPGVSSHWRAGR